MIGIMKNDVKLLGTSLELKRGQKVILVPATNQPNPKGKYFVRPPGGRWEDATRPLDDSILLTEEDVKIISDSVGKRKPRGTHVNQNGED